LAVGDGGYAASVVRRKDWREHHAAIVTTTSHTKKKVITHWQLLASRQTGECAFDYPRRHLLLVTSFPSVSSYAVHYIRVELPADVGFESPGCYKTSSVIAINQLFDVTVRVVVRVESSLWHFHGMEGPSVQSDMLHPETIQLRVGATLK